MAEVKWIKLTTDMFDNRKIKHLRKLPDGNNIVLIWVMLLTMAGRCNAGGMIFLTENIPYTPKMLADELDFEESTVRLALEALEQFNMIVTDSGYFAIAGWEEYQNIEGMEKIREQTRKRVARHRENKRVKLIGNTKKCVYCGGLGDTVDHIIPKAKGGLDIPENTVCSCLSCNMQKNDYDVAKFLNDRLLLQEPVDIASISENEVLRKYVRFDYSMQRFVALQVTQGNATEREEDKEKDIEEEKKSKRETSHTLFQRLLADYVFSDYLQAKIAEWITYKTERKESYKEQGMKALLRQIENNAMKYGDEAVCQLIDECMSSGWKGIIFDRLKNPNTRVSYQKTTKADELNDFYKMAQQFGGS